MKFVQKGKVIKPQYAIQRLYEATKNLDDVFITTEVGQHQMWAAQFYGFEKPNHWLTSGGLGTMGYGMPAALGVQVAHPDALVIEDADGDYVGLLETVNDGGAGADETLSFDGGWGDNSGTYEIVIQAGADASCTWPYVMQLVL